MTTRAVSGRGPGPVIVAAARVSSMALPQVPGFVVSRFGPLVVAAARRCLGAPDADGNHVAGRGEHTAIVLASVFGDSTSLDVAAEQVAGGRLPDPLLAYQAVPTSILGVLSREYAITGPISCVSALHDLGGEMLAVADLLLNDADVDQVLAIAVELSPGARVEQVRHRLAAEGTPVDPPAEDTAVCLLLRRADAGGNHHSAVLATDGQAAADAGEVLEGLGVLRSLASLCAQVQCGAPVVSESAAGHPVGGGLA